MGNIRKASYYLVFFFVTLFLIGASYLKGLFFDEDLYLIETISSAIFMLFLIIHFNKLKEIFKQPYIWLLSIMPFIYLLHAFVSENQLFAYQTFLRWVMVVEFFVIIQFLKERRIINELIWVSILVMGLWTSLFSWLAAFNIVDFKDAYLDFRFSSVFQYPNTFAAIISGVLISVLIRSTSNKWKYSISSLTSFVLFTSLIFTYSRGGWLVFALIWFIGLFFFRLKEQVLYISHTLLIGIATLLSINSLNQSIVDKTYVKGLTVLILNAILVGFLYMLIYFLSNKISWFNTEKKGAKWIIPVIIIIIGGSGIFAIFNTNLIDRLPSSIQKRIHDINFETKSVAERGIFYKDAIEMFKENALFGDGGGAWKQKYDRYQSLPYSSREVHNYYFQLLIETGIFGLIIFISFLLLILISIFKSRNNLNGEDANKTKSLFLLAVLLLIHSFIDFNMSYGYFSVLVFTILSLLVNPLEFKLSKNKIYSFFTISLILIFTFTSIILSFRFYYADSLDKRIREGKIENGAAQINKMISLNPYNIDYRFKKIDYLQQTGRKDQNTKNEIIKEIIEINKMNQKNPKSMLKLGLAQAMNGFYVDSLNTLDEGIDNAPWRLYMYDQYSVINYKVALYYKNIGKTEEFKRTTDSLLVKYKDIQKRRAFLNEQIESLQYWEFRPSDLLKLYVGQTYIIRGENKKAKELILELINSKDKRVQREAYAWAAYLFTENNDLNKAKEFINKGQEKGIPVLDILKQNLAETGLSY